MIRVTPYNPAGIVGVSNVRVVISDKKIGEDDDNDNRVDYYLADVVDVYDYHPFGSFVAGRTVHGSEYRYGFNGMEKDDELTDIKGTHYDFGARMYDSRLGRWMKVDPLANEYPGVSTYAFVLNTPIQAIDPDGMRVYFIIYDERLPDGADAAGTRESEILNQSDFDSNKDHIYKVSLKDLEEQKLDLESFVHNSVQDAKDKGYGKTVEATFITHGGGDGPVVGESVAGKYDLADVPGYTALEQGQISQEGWESIDFNFDPENSILCAYGCNTASFAMDFVGWDTKAKFALGVDGTAGGSEEWDEWDANWITQPWDDVYFTSAWGFDHVIQERAKASDEGASPTPDGQGYSKSVPSFTGNATVKNGKVINASEDKKSSSGPGGSTNHYKYTCFVAGTKVLMNDFTEKSIENIVEGDTILSVDINTMQIETDVVLQLPKEVRKYNKIKAVFSDGTENQFSPAHPYWVKGKGWCVFDTSVALKELDFDVKQLNKGDIVYKFQKGTLIEVKIEQLYDTEEKVVMYNVENVKTFHTFLRL